MICSKCGAELPDNSMFCFICGEDPNGTTNAKDGSTISQENSGKDNKVNNDEPISEEKMQEFLERLRQAKNRTPETDDNEASAISDAENNNDIQASTEEVGETVEEAVEDATEGVAIDTTEEAVEAVAEEPATEEVTEAEEPATEEESEEAVEEAKTEEVVVEEPATEVVAEEVVEEAKTEEVVAEESATEVVAEEAEKVVEEAKTEEVVAEEQATEEVTEEVVEEAKTEEVVAEEPATEEVTEKVVEEAKTEEVVVEEPATEVVAEEAVEEAKTEEVVAEEQATEVVAEEAVEEAKTEEVVAEEPATEAVIEEAVEEAKAEEAVAEEPATEEVIEEAVEEAKTEEVVAEEPATEEVIEEAVEEAKTEEVVAEEPATEEVTKEVVDETKTEEVDKESPTEEKKEESEATDDNKEDNTPTESEEKIDNAEDNEEERPMSFGKILDKETKEKLGIESFYREHVDYDEMIEAKNKKNDMILQRVTAIIVTIVIIIIAYFLITKTVNNKKYTDLIEKADKYCQAEQYDEAVATLKEARDLEVADVNDVANKIADIYVLQEDYKTAAAELIYSYNNYKNDAGIYARYKEYNAVEVADNDDKKESDKAAEVTEAAKTKAPEKTKEPEKTAKPTVSVAKGNYKELLSVAKDMDESATLEEKVAAYEAAMEASPYMKDTYLAIADLYQAAGKNTEAVAILNQGLEKCSESSSIAATLAEKAINEKLKEFDTVVAETTEEPVQTETPAEPVVTEPEEPVQTANETVLAQIYDVMDIFYTRNIVSNVVTFASQNDFTDAVSSTEKVYLQNGVKVDTIASGIGMIAYTNGYIYYGNIQNGIRNGKGILIATTINNSILDYYIYNGNWAADMPEGQGLVTCVTASGQANESLSITSGYFAKGLENGKMKLKKTVEGELYGVLEYTAVNGAPQALKDASGKNQSSSAGTYIIGNYINGNKKQVASVEDGTIWKVQGLE